MTSGVKGRGAQSNPANRFEKIALAPDPESDLGPESGPPTLVLKDLSQTLITYNDSPDVGFSAGINPYRGCLHGCIYCFARPTHEYFGFSSGLDFESKILVKENAPQLLRRELASPKWKPQVLAMSGVTDCYQPLEKQFELTRGCLEVLAEFRNPVCIITKNHLVTRDLDHLSELASHQAALVNISITTLDATLTPRMEPRASLPRMRLEAIRRLASAGIPVNVLVAPVIPGLTDHEMPSILEAAAEAGATSAGYVPLRLPHAVKQLFQEWLDLHFPARKEKILGRIRSLRGGRLNDARFGSRMQGEGVWAEQFARMFEVAARKAGLLPGRRRPLSTAAFRRREPGQLDLF